MAPEEQKVPKKNYKITKHDKNITNHHQLN